MFFSRNRAKPDLERLSENLDVVSIIVIQKSTFLIRIDRVSILKEETANEFAKDASRIER